MTEFRYRRALLGLVLLIAVFTAGFVISGGEVARLTSALQQYPVLAPAIYLLLVVASVVLAPLASLPLIPVAVGAWGVPTVTVLNVVGWWTGAVIAFELARVAGRPVLRRIVSLEKIEQWVARFSERTAFLSIVLMRMILPIEIPSYALGLVKNVNRSVHALASLVGIIPFAILWTLMGGALIAGQWLRMLLIIVALGCALAAAWYFWRRNGRYHV